MLVLAYINMGFPFFLHAKCLVISVISPYFWWLATLFLDKPNSYMLVIYIYCIYISRYNITVFYTNNNYELFPWWKTDGFTIQGPPCYPWTESFPRSLNELLVGFPVEIPGDLNNFYSPTLRCPNLPFLDYFPIIWKSTIKSIFGLYQIISLLILEHFEADIVPFDTSMSRWSQITKLGLGN